jgi:hypothetical protein
MQKTKGLSALYVQWQRLSQWLKTNQISISPKSAHAVRRPMATPTSFFGGGADKDGNMVNTEVAGLARASLDAAPYVMGHFTPVLATTGDYNATCRHSLWRLRFTIRTPLWRISHGIWAIGPPAFG